MARPGPELLSKLLICDAATGRLFWRARPPEMFEGKRSTWRSRKWNSNFAGKEAGHQTQEGYRTVRIFDVSYLVHHVIWALVHGVWPEQIDHRLGIEAGDGIDNLRPSTQSQNMQNSRKRSDNKSGFKGVSWDGINQKWVVRIRAPGGKYENLGRFDEAAEGHKAYQIRAIELYGQFARFE